MKTRALAAMVALSVILPPTVLPVMPAAAFTVFDPSNFAQNVIQAARELEQINNQIIELQNQATMLQNMARNLQNLDFSSLGQITGALQRIDGLMMQAQGIGFDLARTQAAFREQFPESYDTVMATDDFIAGAQAQWRNAMEAYGQTMRVQAHVVENVQADSALLGELVTQSQGAVGALQAQQATNQLLALSIKQQLQVQNLMAAQYRADALDDARRTQAEAAAREATKRFLGDGNAYTPR